MHHFRKELLKSPISPHEESVPKSGGKISPFWHSSSGGQEQSSGAHDPCASELPVVLSGSSSGTIQSPNYPSDYPNDADCNWVVEVGGGVVVELTIVTFDVEDG